MAYQKADPQNTMQAQQCPRSYAYQSSVHKSFSPLSSLTISSIVSLVQVIISLRLVQLSIITPIIVL